MHPSPSKKRFSFRWWFFFAGIVALLTLVYPLDGFFTMVGLLFWAGIFGLPVLVFQALVQIFNKSGWSTRSLFGLLTPLIAWACLAWSTWVEPYQLQVNELTLEVPHLNREVRLLHISDIQSDHIDGYEEEVFRQIQALQADLLIHTGDLVQVPGGDKDRKELKALAALFVPIQPPLGKFHVPGDTDPGTPIEDFDQWSGVTTLKNGEAVIEKEGVRLAVLGLSLASSRQGYRSGIAEWLERQPKGSLTVVAGHAPDYAITAADLPADLLLAGHTHGGQVRLPFIGPLLTLSKVPKDWARGYTQLANTHLHVSAGIGAEHEPWLPAIRFNCPPEITLIHLVPKS